MSASGREAASSLEQRRGVRATGGECLAPHAFDELGVVNVIAAATIVQGLIVWVPQSVAVAPPCG